MMCGCESVGGTTSECVVCSTVSAAACDGVSRARGHAGMIFRTQVGLIWICFMDVGDMKG